MTITKLEFTSDDLGIQSFDAVVVDRARKHVIDNLNAVTTAWSDNRTRIQERIEENRNPKHPPGRRDYTSIVDSNFFMRFEKGNIIITNSVYEDAGQFRMLYYGNGDGLIIPRKSKVLKFYSRRYDDWIYTTYVNPISPHIIHTFQRDIKDAIVKGLTEAAYEIEVEMRESMSVVAAREVEHDFELDQREALETIHGKQQIEEEVEAEQIPIEDKKEMLSTGSIGIIKSIRDAVVGAQRWLRKIW